MRGDHTTSSTGLSFEVAARWALRRVHRGTVRQHDRGFFTDAGRAVPDWLAATCQTLIGSGYLAEDPARPGILTETAPEFASRNHLTPASSCTHPSLSKESAMVNADETVDFAELRTELIARAAADQRARAELDPARPTSAQWERVAEVDRENVRWFAPLVAVHGWPGRRMVGVDGAHAACVIAQHAPAPYRATWLPKLHAAVRDNDASARDLAYLSDRVATDQERPQCYGTQWLRIGDTSRLYPLGKPATVNLHRVEIKLDPLPDTDIESAYTSYTEIAGGSS